MRSEQPQNLKRVLSLPLVVLYGLGVTIGAGIYVLVGETAGRAGMLAPLSFLTAAVVMLFPALCFAELSGRYPFASGAAQYAEESFGSRAVGLGIGLLVISAGLVAASTISLGSVQYLGSLINIPPSVLLITLVGLMALICIWGIKESVIFAGIMTLIEIGGLLAVIIGGFVFDYDLLMQVDRLLPDQWTNAVLSGVLQASLLAFFAFIGFEGIANIAEETVNPRRTLPVAVLLTLAISSAIYALVVSIAVLTVGPENLAVQRAPLAYLFEQTTGLPASVITVIAVLATLNGVIVQMIMVSRLAYGLSSRGLLPSILCRVHAVRQTPVISILLTSAMIMALSLLFPVVELAEWTSRIILLVFSIVCVALFRLKLKGVPSPAGGFEVGAWVPAAGAILCAGLLAADLIWG